MNKKQVGLCGNIQFALQIILFKKLKFVGMVAQACTLSTQVAEMGSPTRWKMITTKNK